MLDLMDSPSIRPLYDEFDEDGIPARQTGEPRISTSRRHPRRARPLQNRAQSDLLTRLEASTGTARITVRTLDYLLRGGWLV